MLTLIIFLINFKMLKSIIKILLVAIIIATGVLYFLFSPTYAT